MPHPAPSPPPGPGGGFSGTPSIWYNAAVNTVPKLETKRTFCTIARTEHRDLLYSYYRENRARLAPWEPLRAPSYFTPGEIEKRLAAGYEDFIRTGTLVPFIALDKETGEAAGLCTFSNVVRGPFQACHLGYSVSGCFEGKGIMFEILSRAIGYVFEDLKLHRIMANYMPSNKRSGALLERLGFEKEGYARSYLKIAGKCEDHILTSLIL